MNSRRFHRPFDSRATRQRGVVLLFSLIALVIMLIAAVALVRSFQGSMFTAGNIAFKRDLQNQSDRAVDKVLTEFRTGSLSTPAARANPVVGKNYSATMLAVDAHGIPTALQDSQFSTYGVVTNDITPANESTLPANQIEKIRYVIDRLCATVGDETTLGSAGCVLANSPVPAGTSTGNWQSAERAGVCPPPCAPAAPLGVIYRLTIRVSGPRNTQSFFQSTFTAPSSL